MTIYEQLNELCTAMNESAEQHKRLSSDLIGAPLAIASEISKEVFSKTLGLEWLVSILVWKYRDRQREFALPTYTLRKGYLERATVEVACKPLVYPLVFWNFFFRNLGKVVGALLVLPWVLLVSPVLRIFYGIQQAIRQLF